MPFKFNPLTGSIDSVNSRSEDAVFSGNVDINPNSVSTAGSPILKITNGTAVSGGKKYSLRPYIPNVSNTGFTIYNESDTRNELSIDGSGNAIFAGEIKLSLGKGIDFGLMADTGTGEEVTSSKLDDYEEGDWSPVVSSGNWSITADKGRYTKIGNVVNAWIVESALSGSGNGSEFIIEGLPFAVSEWTPGSMYAEVFNSESTVKATIAAVSDVGHNDELKVQTWGGTAVGTDFGAGYFNIHVTYRTS